MSELISEYLSKLRAELSAADPALIQDALSDAEEHLWTALELARETEPGVTDKTALEREIEKYGSPAEVASAYLDLESKTGPVFQAPVVKKKRSAAAGFFGVFTDPRAYAAMFYMFYSLFTGIFLFTWAVTGLSLSIGIIILIIGLPVFGIFLLSVRGLALVEGRLIEALLGVRMPRRPIFSRKGLSWRERLGSLFKDSMTWKSILYMILMLPLGIFYFDLIVISLSLSLWGILRPVLEYGFDLPFAEINGIVYYTPGWFMPVAMLTGVLWFFVTLHMARGIGKMHSKIARSLLVRE